MRICKHQEDGIGRRVPVGLTTSIRWAVSIPIALFVLFLAGCGAGPSDTPDTVSAEEVTPSIDGEIAEIAETDVEATPDVGPETSAPYACEGEEDPASDPLRVLGRQEPLCPLPTHFLDIVHDPETGRTYSVGLPGLVIHQDTEGEPQHLSFFPEVPPDLEAPSALREYEHVALLPGGLLVASARLPAQRQFESENTEPLNPGTECPNGCPPDWECLEEVGCSHGCSTSSDCQAPEDHCIYGWCTSTVDGPCEKMGHCAPGHACASGSCVPVSLECFTSEQCAGDSQCVDDTCVHEEVPCQASGTCSGDRHCIEGLCSWTPEGCVEVTDCATYHRCHDGVCVPEARQCDEDLQCDASEVCIQDACIARDLYCPGGCDAGLVIIDPVDGVAAQLVSALVLESAAGMAVQDDRLYQLTYTGRLLTVDISDPTVPTVIHEVTGLESPRKLVIVGSYAYVADHSQGLVVVDLQEPDSPSLGDVFETGGGPLDIASDGEHLFVACGTAGLQVFSLEEPDAPNALSLTSVGTSMLSVSVSQGLAWTTDQEGLQVMDMTDPANPIVLATETTPSWAMAVDAHGTRVWISDWNAVTLAAIDIDLSAPDADPSRSEIYLTDGPDSRSLTISNRGAAPLEGELRSSDTRLDVSPTTVDIPPGQSINVTVTLTGDGKSVDGEVCLLTNDPDEPAQRIQVASTSEGSSVLVGESAPDFLLPDLNGELHQLADQEGHPVVLCYFATW